MTSPQPFRHDVPARAFLVERYLSAAAAEELAASTARVARLCADADHPATWHRETLMPNQGRLRRRRCPGPTLTDPNPVAVPGRSRGTP